MKPRTRQWTLVAAAVCVLASAAPARDFKVVKLGEPDATDIKTLAATVTAGCKSDQERAIALWGYITRRPYYHWWCIEDPEGTTELGYMLDPISRFNVYGTVICFQVQHSLAAMCEQVGLKARQRDLGGHAVLEIFYDGGWHLFDAQVDCASYFHADDGQTILDLAGVRADATKYVINQAHPSNPYFQYDHYGGKFLPWETKLFCATNFYNPIGTKPIYASLRTWGHHMHMDLRRGERLTRYFSRKGRWYCPPDFFSQWGGWGGSFYDSWKGYHDMRDPKNHYVNGLLLYQPDWRNPNNFLDGLYQGHNYVLQDGKVRPASPGEAYVILRVQSPYLIVGKPGTLDVGGDSYGGAILEADFYRKDTGGTNSVAVSTDNGLTWQSVWVNDQTGARHVKVDMTNEVEGKYGYLIKITTLGEAPEDASVANVKLSNYLFMSPVPLPAMTAGINRFRFIHKPAEAPFWLRPHMGDTSGYTRFFDELNNLIYNSHFTQHLSPGSGGRGHAVVKVDPPAGWKIHRLTVLGSYGIRSTLDLVQVLCKTDVDPKWVYAWKGGFEASAHWRRERTVDINLRQPANTCYVKFRLKKSSGHCSLNTYRIYAHCTRPAEALSPGSVKITHSWLADGASRSRTVVPSLDGHTYAIRATGTKIVNRAIIVEVANDPPPDNAGAPANSAAASNSADPRPSAVRTPTPRRAPVRWLRAGPKRHRRPRTPGSGGRTQRRSPPGRQGRGAGDPARLIGLSGPACLAFLSFFPGCPGLLPAAGGAILTPSAW